MLGIKRVFRSEEHNHKISLALKGKAKSDAHRHSLSEAAILRLKNPEANPNFRGDDVGYVGIHIWLRKTFGYPIQCEMCGKKGERINGKWNLVWALKSGYEYRRVKDNFFHLCNKCHRNYDKTEEWNQQISVSKMGKKRRRILPLNTPEEGGMICTNSI